VLQDCGNLLVAARAHNDGLQRTRDVIAEQNAAYQASLAADQARERQQQEQQRQRERQQQEVDRKRSALPPEPVAGTSGAVTVAVRLPDGTRLTRRFMTAEPIQHIYFWLDVQHADRLPGADKYLLCTAGFPRQTLNDLTPTIEQAKLGASTVLFVQEKQS